MRPNRTIFRDFLILSIKRKNWKRNWQTCALNKKRSAKNVRKLPVKLKSTLKQKRLNAKEEKKKLEDEKSKRNLLKWNVRWQKRQKLLKRHRVLSDRVMKCVPSIFLMNFKRTLNALIFMMEFLLS